MPMRDARHNLKISDTPPPLKNFKRDGALLFESKEKAEVWALRVSQC